MPCCRPEPAMCGVRGYFLISIMLNPTHEHERSVRPLERWPIAWCCRLRCRVHGVLPVPAAFGVWAAHAVIGEANGSGRRIAGIPQVFTAVCRISVIVRPASLLTYPVANRAIIARLARGIGKTNEPQRREERKERKEGKEILLFLSAALCALRVSAVLLAWSYAAMGWEAWRRAFQQRGVRRRRVGS
jgi:hypothetical protein